MHQHRNTICFLDKTGFLEQTAMKLIKPLLLTAFISIGSPLLLSAADPIAEARQLLADDDPAGAREMLRPLFDNTAATRLSGEANYLMGLCEFQEGDFHASLPYFENAKNKGITHASIYLGRLAYMSYDLDKARNLFNEFRRHKNISTEQAELLNLYEKQLEEGRRAMEHVQKLTVIEKKAIPSTDIWKYITLPSSAGKLLSPDSIPFEKGRSESVIAFANEAGDYMMWCESDDEGRYRIVESTRLVDGTWQQPHFLSEKIGSGSDADFPFMRADGVTLYFASAGEGSIGGMDLFVATRDPQTGDYLEPRNLGMPFNSAYDDILLAVDEENGIGWLVSDREQLGDRLTLYIYLLEENRVNLDPDDEELIEKAMIADSDILDQEDPISKEKLRLIAAIPEEGKVAKRDFTFRLPKGKVIHTLGEFANVSSRHYATLYLKAEATQEQELAKLRSLRMQYHDTNTQQKKESISNRILELEKSTDERRLELIELRSKTIAAERGEIITKSELPKHPSR